MPSKVLNILDRPIPKGTTEVALSAFSFLFSEIVQHTKLNPTPVKALSTWEHRLHGIGYRVGARMLDLVVYRTKGIDSRETDLIRFLTFVQNTVWKVLFGKQAEGLMKADVKGEPHEVVFLILDSDPLVCHFVCTPSDYNNFSSAAFVAGIIAGMCDGAEFPAEVSAHNKGKGREISYEIEFKKHVFQRNEKLTR
eukprot:Rhum_TRINITY_DN21150_c0_g1::Rhum_TRINITY_DN21150_c0_g1_i1::g.173294::m.173294/K20280/TRAPPC5, TRS31; trafficking protein particle complex subunit 5